MSGQAASLTGVGALDRFDRGRLAGHAADAAQALLGAILAREEPDGSLSLVRIVETEAYREDDPASHSAAGRTARTWPMFEGPGTAYVYRSYGIHWCLNVAAEPAGIGAAVLVRAASALTGERHLWSRRPAAHTHRELLRGPGRLCQALAVTGADHDGIDLLDGRQSLRLLDDGFRPSPREIGASARVGVRLGADVPWRFFVAGRPEVSAYRKHPRAAVR